MYCERCGEHLFGGSLCPSCGGRLMRGVSSYSVYGALLARGPEVGIPEKGPALLARKGAVIKSEPAGHGPGLFVRVCYKFFESMFACALFSVALRVAVFLVKVVDSLMETGGDIKEGISFYADMQMAIGWYECAAWILIVTMIFKYRHRAE